jgi:hypothetical protein
MHTLRRRLRCSPLLACLLLITSGCASVSPRFSQDVQASFARDEMRKLTTRSMELYYPEHLKPTALRIAARVEACVDRLQELSWSKRPRDRMLIYLTSTSFNNAYVQPDLPSIPQQMVMPVNMSLELFNLLDLGQAELGDVGCHEAVHYVQMQQVDGLWHGLNLVTGGIVQPNVFTESWFLEGLATYYEGQFDRETGRPHSPIWRGFFEAAVQARGGEFNPGYLSPEHRDMDPFGGSYLTGSHFVGWLVRKYGEKKLWQLIHEQGQSWFPPFGVTLRFRGVYGVTIGTLFEQYTAELRRDLKPRKRPASQSLQVQEVGYYARLATSAGDGATAIIHVGREETPHLTVRERNGAIRFSRGLTQYLPGRDWIVGNPSVMSGLSFTRDGALLYLVAADVNSQGGYLSRVWRVDARTGEVQRMWEIQNGMGGSVTPDGTGYIFIDTQADTANLVRLELETGKQEPVTRFEGHVSLGAPAVSPDGARVVFSMRGPEGWDLALRGTDGSVRWLTRDGRFNYSPRWVDDDQIVFLREHDGRLQGHALRLSSGELARITDAPHLVMDVWPAGDGQVTFLNRDGVDFTLDRAPLAAMAEEAPRAVAATSPTPAAAPVPPAPAAPPPAAPAAPPADDAFTEFPGTPAPTAPGTETPEAAPSPASGDSEAPPGAPTVFASVPLGEAPIAEPPPAPGKEVEVLSDAPYSTLERIWYPELRVPFVLAFQDPDTEEVGVTGYLSLAGQDRLGFHSWALNLSYNSLENDPSVSVSYGNAVPAPWYVLTGFSYSKTADQRDLTASISASRSFWTTPVAFGLFGLRRQYFDSGQPAELTTLFGPEISTSYFAGESTSYGGTQRGLGLSGSAAVYPKAFGSDATMGDLRGEVSTYTGGLPGFGKDNLVLTLTGRFLPGAPQGLLEVGGVPLGSPFYQSEPNRGAGLPPQLQPGTAFSEYLRGYEDFGIRARHAVIGSASYRYRFIIDYGWASTIYLLPSLFVSQFELQGFGSWAITDFEDHHRAVGGAARLNLTLGQLVPFGLYYQYAYRYDHGLDPLHMVGLAF